MRHRDCATCFGGEEGGVHGDVADVAAGDIEARQLGVIDPIKIAETAAELHAGQTLLMFTDGVTEAGRPDDALGSNGLRELCREAPSLSLQGLLERIERAAVERSGGYLHDDIALLALCVSVQPTAER